jgi:PAS domain S-box-containing protein
MTATSATSELGSPSKARRIEHHEHMMLLFRQLPGAAWITDRNLRVQQYIGYVEKNLQVAHDAIVGMAVADLAETRDATDPVIAAHRAALDGKSPPSFPYYLNRHWYEVHIQPLRERDGEVIGCIGAALEITDRVEREQRAAAREAELAELQRRTISLLEATIESTADGILVVDRSGKILAFNARFLTLWHVDPTLAAHGSDEELIAFVLDQLVDPDAFLRRVRELYEAPYTEQFDTVQFKDGRVFERFSRPQQVDGNIVGRVWSFRDVTEREHMLRDALLLADASRLLSSLAPTFALEGVARRVLAYLGDACAIDVCEGGVMRRLVTCEKEPGRAIEIEIPSPVERSRIREQDGRNQITVSMPAAGRVVGYLAVVGPPGRLYTNREIDVLEELGRRCAVALENAHLYKRAQDDVRAREEFLAVAAHEIRGPIAAIRLAVDGLRTNLVPSTTLVDIIDREEHRLASLVDELLDLGQVQSGKLHLALEPVDLALVVREVAARLKQDLARSGSRLTISGAPSVIGQWDQVRLDQVVMNLLSNANKFGLGKPITIELRSTTRHAELTITDHGIGIPGQRLASVFEPFERAVPARHYGGLGLGLYIVRSIITRLGGTIDVHSKVGEGTTFVIELPRTVDS